MNNIYGDGTSSEKIAKVLTSVPLGPELLVKRAMGTSKEPVIAAK